MGARAVGVTDTASGAGVADVRVRERTDPSLGTTVAEQYVIPINERVPSFIGSASTFRTLGTAAASPHWLFHIINGTGSGKVVVIRQLTWYMDSTAATTAINVIGTVCRPTGTEAGGTALTKTNVGTGADAAESSHANVVLDGATASDGGVATAITGLTVANRIWRAFGMRLHTAVGQASGMPKELVPPALRNSGIVLRDAEQLAVQLDYTASDNPATMHHIVNCLWEEYTLP
jgi:hypothetical protein